MEAAGDFVISLPEFTAGMQGGEEDFHSAFFCAAECVNRNASAVILEGDGFSVHHLDLDEVAVSIDCLVDGIIENFPDQVVQARGGGGPNIHCGAFPDGFEMDPRAGVPLPATTVVDVQELGDAKRRAFLEHQSQIDHLALFDQLAADFDGTELYHRVHPAWQEGAPRESGLRISVR